MAITSTASAVTTGVYTRAKRLTNTSTGARRASACRIRATMRASVLWAASAVTVTSSAPSTFIVPPYTGSPTPLDLGSDSPVMVASFTAEVPSTTCPSNGTRSPGRIRMRSPIASSSTATVSPVPSGRSRSAVSGASSRSRAMERRPRSTE